MIGSVEVVVVEREDEEEGSWKGHLRVGRKVEDWREMEVVMRMRVMNVSPPKKVRRVRLLYWGRSMVMRV